MEGAVDEEGNSEGHGDDDEDDQGHSELDGVAWLPHPDPHHQVPGGHLVGSSIPCLRGLSRRVMTRSVGQCQANRD